jgi:hypothetical protein
MDAQPERSIVIGPMGIGEVVDRGFTLARRNFRYLAGIGAWGIVIGYVLQSLLSIPLLSMMDSQTIDRASAADVAAMGISGTIGALIAAVGTGLAGIAITLACVRIVDSAGEVEPFTTGAAYREALGRFLPLIGLGIIIVLASIPLLIIFPLAIWIWGRWSVSWNAVIIERHGPISALRRSWGLTRRAWWHTVIVLFLAGLAIAIVQGALGAVLGLAVQATVFLLQVPLVTAVLNAITSSALAILVTPFSAAVGVVLYYELRARAEGFDLEQRLIQAAPAE